MLVLIVLNRGAQIVGARLLWQLNFVQWHLFVDCQCGPIFMSLFCHLEYWGGFFLENLCSDGVEPSCFGTTEILNYYFIICLSN